MIQLISFIIGFAAGGIIVAISAGFVIVYIAKKEGNYWYKRYQESQQEIYKLIKNSIK